MEEQSVIVYFTSAAADPAPIHDLGDRLASTVEAAGAGRFDGSELALDGSEGYFYLYGKDARLLLAAIRPILDTAAPLHTIEVELRFGADPATCETEVVTLRPGATA